MANQQTLMHTTKMERPATDALAITKVMKMPSPPHEEMNRGHHHHVVDVSSLLLVEDLRREAASPDLFPSIEWSCFVDVQDISPTTTKNNNTNHHHHRQQQGLTNAELLERAETLRQRLRNRRIKKRLSSTSAGRGLVRSKSLLCLPSAARDMEYLIRRSNKEVSSSSTTCIKRRNSSLAFSSPTTPSSTTPHFDFVNNNNRDTSGRHYRPSTSSSSSSSSTTARLFARQFLNAFEAKQKQQQQVTATKKAVALVTRPHPQESTNPQGSEENMFLTTSFLEDCPFPTCP